LSQASESPDWSAIDWAHYRSIMRRVAGSVLGGSRSYAIEDAAAEAFVGFVRAMRRGKVDHPEAMASTIAYNVAVTVLRGETSPFRPRTTSVDEMDRLPHPGMDPDREQRLRRMRFVLTEFWTLHPDCEQVLLLPESEGLSGAAIAERLGLTHDNVRKKQERCREKLRAALANDPFPDWESLARAWREA
jgi:RNA polymerase sigma factor (sigma-70 family)